MLGSKKSAATWVIAFVLALVVALAFPISLKAQDNEQPSLFGSIAKQVVLDPTTYAPAAIAYGATMRDWNTSQPLFNSGFVEGNARFTISGLPNDRPIGYAEGQRQILRDAFVNLQMSVVNNATNRLIENVLIARHPEHRTLFRTLGWIERIGFASFLSYKLSAEHLQQANLNEQRAAQMGVR
jgi:hypothetical protein